MSIKSFIRICSFPILFFILYFLCAGDGLQASDLEKLQRGHFVIYHSNRALANKLSWKAEYHYKRIINHFGTEKFEPWEDENKCPIYLYRTKDDYLKATGAPEWSEGLAQYSPFRFSSYEDAPGLLVSTLPHEMTHMLLFLYMDKKPIPTWLNEGMAQFEEEDRSLTYQRKRLIKQYIRRGTYISLAELINMKNIPKDKVSLFYAEAASVIDHLITDNIRANYGRFLTFIKDGDTVEEALKNAYQWKYKNGISDLEARWLDYVKKRY
jgi:hypothetical protein